MAAELQKILIEKKKLFKDKVEREYKELMDYFSQMFKIKEKYPEIQLIELFNEKIGKKKCKMLYNNNHSFNGLYIIMNGSIKSNFFINKRIPVTYSGYKFNIYNNCEFIEISESRRIKNANMIHDGFKIIIKHTWDYLHYLKDELDIKSLLIQKIEEKLQSKIDLIDKYISPQKEVKIEKICDCGHTIPKNAKFCPNCGYKFDKMVKVISSYSDTKLYDDIKKKEKKEEEKKDERYCPRCNKIYLTFIKRIETTEYSCMCGNNWFINNKEEGKKKGVIKDLRFPCPKCYKPYISIEYDNGCMSKLKCFNCENTWCIPSRDIKKDEDKTEFEYTLHDKLNEEYPKKDTNKYISWREDYNCYLCQKYMTDKCGSINDMDRLRMSIPCELFKLRWSICRVCYKTDINIEDDNDGNRNIECKNCGNTWKIENTIEKKK